MSNILLVGDNSETSRLLSRILTKQGFNVQLLTDNNSTPDNQTDVIIFDLSSSSSPEFCFYIYDEIIKKCSRAKILLLSSNENDEIRALEAGADDFIKKPINIDVFLVRVRSLCKKKLII